MLILKFNKGLTNKMSEEKVKISTRLFKHFRQMINLLIASNDI